MASDWHGIGYTFDVLVPGVAGFEQRRRERQRLTGFGETPEEQALRRRALAGALPGLVAPLPPAKAKQVLTEWKASTTRKLLPQRRYT